ncbi:putative carboxypeptidase S1 [Seiridium cardinale]
MIGLFSKNGPCQFYNNDTKPSLNPYSFNEHANMVYIDQPVGVGSSYGAPCCNSTETASIPVWNLIQAFNGEFPEYGSRQFGIFGESYGGRYLRLFADEVLDKNNGIANGTVNGTHVNLTTLGINDGTHDAKIWYRALIDYAHDKPYRQLTNDSMVEEYIANYQETCLPLLGECCETGADDLCYDGYYTCSTNGISWLEEINNSDFDPYDVRLPLVVGVPLDIWVDYLYRAHIQKAIGARVNFTQSS